MIQRIQTLYLLIISLSSSLGWFLLPDLDPYIMDFPLFKISKIYLITSGGIAFMTLLLYNNRKLQLLLNRIHFIVQILTEVGLVYGFMISNKMIDFLTWSGLPALILILLILSIRAIQKDENLVRSIDRLR